ncbi:FRG domain-containing protein [Microbacteriaceae bacterium 4G12]
MCSLEPITINTLNEYIQVIKEKKLSEYYFRGENDEYPTISSSLLRKETSVLLKNKSFSFYEDVVNYYYSEIASNIGELERENFLAFSQHHGLTTNLIDFTTSPLIALYFACERKNNNSKENNGFVYLINKNNTIDISKIINEEFESPAYSYNLTEKFVSNKRFFRTFSAYLNDFFCNSSFDLYKDILIKQSINLFTITNGLTQTFLEEYIEMTKNISKTTLFDDLSTLLSKHLSRYDMRIEGVPFLTGIYIILLREYFETLSSMSFLNNKEGTIEFPQMPYLIYKTPYKFDRIRNQDGVFLYQLFHTYATQYEDVPNAIVRQVITPDITIIVNNQKQILEELDFIGINLKSIYGDFDNTASYINNKFF